MKYIKDRKIIILVLLIAVFTMVYFVIVNRISYSFSNNYDFNELYKIKIDTIKKCAIAYAEKHRDMFKKENVVYIKVQDLIDESFLLPNNEGNIINPLNENTTLNSNIIKLKIENDVINVVVDS